MHDNLWAGVELKLRNAEFHLDKMNQSFQSPERTAINVALESSGASIGIPWHISFYAYLDAFLSATRSVAEVIKCCFGHDDNKKMGKWFMLLDPPQRARRCLFSKEFNNHYSKFCKLPLAQARNISEHRLGYPPVTVKINGMFGVTYIGGATKPVPTTQTRHEANSEFSFLDTPFSLRPGWKDFKIEGNGLLIPACREYLETARSLVAEARRISEKVHGNNELSLPDIS